MLKRSLSCAEKGIDVARSECGLHASHRHTDHVDKHEVVECVDPPIDAQRLVAPSQSD